MYSEYITNPEALFPHLLATDIEIVHVQNIPRMAQHDIIIYRRLAEKFVYIIRQAYRKSKQLRLLWHNQNNENQMNQRFFKCS